jgi:hypothetical protein
MLGCPIAAILRRFHNRDGIVNVKLPVVQLQPGDECMVGPQKHILGDAVSRFATLFLLDPFLPDPFLPDPEEGGSFERRLSLSNEVVAAGIYDDDAEEEEEDELEEEEDDLDAEDEEDNEDEFEDDEDVDEDDDDVIIEDEEEEEDEDDDDDDEEEEDDEDGEEDDSRFVRRIMASWECPTGS